MNNIKTIKDLRALIKEKEFNEQIEIVDKKSDSSNKYQKNALCIDESDLSENKVLTFLREEVKISSCDTIECQLIISLEETTNDNFFKKVSSIRGKVEKSLADDSNSKKIEVWLEINSCLDFNTSMLEKGIDDEKIDLRHLIFENKVTFEECTFDKNTFFTGTKFCKELSFAGSKFQKKVRFHWCRFEDTVSFENTTFNGLADFYKSIFKKNQQFVRTDFLDVSIFSNMTFEEEVQFYYNKTKSDSIISFENATFRKGLDISRANFWCKLNFWGVQMPNFDPKSIRDSAFYQSDQGKDEDIEESHKRESSLRKIRESFRIIKNELRKENNHIESMKFHHLEMKTYHEELKCDRYKNISKEIILYLNKISNNYGLKWERGVVFTLSVSLIFYILFLYSVGLRLEFTPTSVGQWIKHLLQFINLTNWNYAPFGINEYDYAYLILFIGRIFIGYGIYQTVQAFRQYGKN